MNEIKLYRSKWSTIWPLAGSLAFVIAGINQVISGVNAPIWVIWTPICFFGIFSLIMLFILFNRRPWLIINGKGIHGRTTNLCLFEWKFIKDAKIKRILFMKCISLEVDENYTPPKRISFLNGKSNRRIQTKAPQKFILPAYSINVDVNKLKDLILKMISPDINETDKDDLLRKKPT
jgi:hypothetical protein